VLNRIQPFRTLRGRLATTYACLALIGVVASAAYTTYTLRSNLHERIAYDLVDEARVLADGLADPLADDDTATASSYVQRSTTLTHARMLLVDHAGQQVASSSQSPAAEDDDDLALALSGKTTIETDPFGQLFGGTEIVRVSLPVVSRSGVVVGALQATYTLDDVQAVLGRPNATTLLVAIGAVLVAVAAGFVLATPVARPARQVAEAASALASRRATGLPFGSQANAPFPSLPIPRGGPEELRALVNAFNGLADQLRLHEQARREFASDVSHELHSLASAMQTAAEALERGAAQANPALGQRLIGGLVGHTRRLSRLADDLLELARWEGGRLRVDTHEMDLAQVVSGTLDEWTLEARRRGISLQARLPVARLPMRGDPIRLAQALGNLVENALKYAGAGGWVRVDVAAEAALGRGYEIAVTDSGPGIPPEVLPRVFERYFRVEGRVSGGPGGMGLGLAIARAIVLAHGGELVAESPRGSGARFVMRLPAASQRLGGVQPGEHRVEQAALHD
jgi:two-component system, OmpR family, sensor histidine kinase BaeS